MRVLVPGLLVLAATWTLHASVEAGTVSAVVEPGGQALLQLQSIRHSRGDPAFPALAFSEDKPGKRLLAIVPGHGDSVRTPVLAASLAKIRNDFPNFLCIVFSYKSEEEFPLEFGALGVPECHVVRGAGVNLEFLKRLPDALLEKSDLVFMLHNDVQLGTPKASVNLTELAEIMERNKLDMASPALLQTNWKYQVPVTHEAAGKVGRRVPVVEFQANLFTREAFKTLRDLVRPDLSKCYGYANLLPAFFESANGREPRFALVDTMLAEHKQGEGIPTTNSACDPSLAKHSLLQLPQAPAKATKCWNPTCNALWMHYEEAGVFPVPFDEALMGSTLEEISFA